MCGLNCSTQFERRHAMLVLASDLDLKVKFKVKYWPKFGTWVKLVSMAVFGGVVILDGRSLNCQNGACDLDLENEVKVKRSNHSVSLGPTN